MYDFTKHSEPDSITWSLDQWVVVLDLFNGCDAISVRTPTMQIEMFGNEENPSPLNVEGGAASYECVIGVVAGDERAWVLRDGQDAHLGLGDSQSKFLLVDIDVEVADALRRLFLHEMPRYLKTV